MKITNATIQPLIPRNIHSLKGKKKKTRISYDEKNPERITCVNKQTKKIKKNKCNATNTKFSTLKREDALNFPTMKKNTK